MGLQEWKGRQEGHSAAEAAETEGTARAAGVVGVA
jgi:hypothetical protein